MQIVTLDPEMPPYSSGKGMAITPLPAKSSSMSFGYWAVSSISAARGATRSWTISRMVSRMASCSSEKPKSTFAQLSRETRAVPPRPLRKSGCHFCRGEACPAHAGTNSAEQRARDHYALDLVRTFVDLERLGVPEVTLERVVREVPVAAGDLQRVGRDVHGG